MPALISQIRVLLSPFYFTSVARCCIQTCEIGAPDLVFVGSGHTEQSCCSSHPGNTSPALMCLILLRCPRLGFPGGFPTAPALVLLLFLCCSSVWCGQYSSSAGGCVPGGICPPGSVLWLPSSSALSSVLSPTHTEHEQARKAIFTFTVTLSGANSFTGT